VEVTVFRRDVLRVLRVEVGAGAGGKLRIERNGQERSGWPAG
jgi:hypothetical protein